MTRLLRYGSAGVVLVAAAVLVIVLLWTAPKQKKAPAASTSPVVAVKALERGSHPVTVSAFGTVGPSREVALAPEVEGRVIAVHSLEPGLEVQAGEVLLEIDPADYRIAVRRAQAGLAQAEADLDVERGRSKVAEREWERFGQTLETVPEGDRAPSLALRAPQLAQAEARVAVARASLEEARLRLARTRLLAPFDAFVVLKSAEVGRRVGPTTPVVTLAGVDTFWGTVSIPVEQARHLAATPEGADVRVVFESGLGEPVERTGRFVRRLPDLETQGRMSRALIAIDDPLGRESAAPAIPAGSYVKVEIAAGVLSDVYEIPREAMRENSAVWVRDQEGALRVRTVTIAWREAESVLVRGAFDAGDELITSYLSDPLPGTQVRTRAREGGLRNGKDG